MAVTIILFVCMYMAFPILFVAMWFEGKPKEKTLFGATIKKEYLEDERVKEVQRKYDKEMVIYGIVLGITPFSAFFTKYFSISYTILIFWLIIMMVVSMIPFMRANSGLMKIKRENGWGKTEQQITYIDTEAAKIQEKLLGKGWFITACLISIVPVAAYIVLLIQGKIEFMQLLAIILIAAITFVLSLVGVGIQRSKGSVVSKDSRVNVTISRVKKYEWAKAMAATSILNAAYTVYVAVKLYVIGSSDLLFLALSIMYSVLTIALLGKAEFTVCNVERKICSNKNSDTSVDDDANWIYGTFYYNKNDNSSLVDKRVGTGFTFNMAKRSIQVLMGIVVVVILILPVTSVFMMADEFVPITCKVQEDKLMVSQYKGEYQIPLNDIKSVELLTDRPRLSKTNGTALDTVMKGSFGCTEYGPVKVCLRPENQYFIVVKTDDKVYLVNAEKDQDTLDVFEKIKK